MVTTEEYNKKLGKYIAVIKKKFPSASPVKNPFPENLQETMEHLLWMLYKIKERIDKNGKVGKREVDWMKFTEGALWALQLISFHSIKRPCQREKK